MGEDKNFVLLGEDTLLGRVCRVCVPLGPTFVVGRPGQALPDLHGAVRVDDADFGADRGGPLVGIATGLSRLESEGIEIALIASSDDASVGVGGLLARLAALREAGPGVVGVCVRFEERRQPLAAAVRVEGAAALARDLLAAGEVRARMWAADFVELSEARYGEVRDVDTPAELAALRKSRSEAE
jgi:molybdopterin-guanine dinucleotide biosynthesis protein A